MNKKNIIIGVLAVLFIVSLIWGYKTNKSAIDSKVITTSENAKTETSDLIASLEKEAKTNYNLLKAKVALLKSKTSLEIDNSKQKSEAELDNAVKYLSEAKSTADEKTKAEIDLLKTKVNTAKNSVVQKKEDALYNVSVAVDETTNMSEKYNDKFQADKEKNIALINRKYAELRAEEALLKAKIASQSEKTYTQAQDYLEEANEWYVRSKEYGNQKTKPYIEQLQKDIENTQTYLKKKDKEARNKISDILQKASELIIKD